MVKVLLKHFIYEKCIDILFNQITLNFSEVKRERLEAKLRNRIDELMKHMDLLGNFSEVKRERVKLRGRKLRGRFLSLKYIDETDIMPTVHYNVREGTF